MDTTFSTFQGTSLTPVRLVGLLGGTGLAFALAWIIRDKQNWVAFGTGGTPPTWKGYLRITKLGLLFRFSGSDLNDASSLSNVGPVCLSRQLPHRQGPRPKINHWTLPQRQEVLPVDAEIVSRLNSLTRRWCESNPDILRHDLSKTEGGHCHAIYARPKLSSRPASARDKILGDEIAHVHPEEHSIHVWLSEADCIQAVRKGWAQRFPLSSLGMLHQGFCFLYTPRTVQECDIVEEIVQAAVAHVTGKPLTCSQ